MSVIDLLDALRVKYGSDAASARALNITRQAVSLLRAGTNRANDSTIVAACALLERDPGPILATHRASLADDPATAAAWTLIAAQLSPAAPAAGNSGEPQEPPADMPPNAMNNDVSNTNYANQKIVRQGREEPLYLCQLGTFGAL